MRNQSRTKGSSNYSAPRSAWLVLGGPDEYDGLKDMASSATGGSTVDDEYNQANTFFVGLPTPDSPQIQRRGKVVTVDADRRWTAGPHVEEGDRLFFYLRSPMQEIHFVATAVSKPFLDEHYRAEHGRRQWRVRFGEIVQIEPIGRAAIEATFEEKRLLLNLSCKYLRPDFANRLLDQVRVVRSRSQDDRERALTRVTGKQKLGDPESITLSGLRGIASDDFTYEEDVERNFCEPLIRLTQLPTNVALKRRHNVDDQRVVDYVLQRSGRPCFAVEVKRKIRWPKCDWIESREFQQARMYSDALKVPFALLDRDRIACFGLGSSEPHLTLERADLVDAELAALKKVILRNE